VSGAERDAVSGMFGSLALPDLHQLLKLAHAAGGARFEALLDGLRVLLRDLPLGMKRLPALLCEDALGHIHRSMASVAEVQSHHPLGPGCTSRQVHTLTVQGAASLRIELDARCMLPTSPPASLTISRTRTADGALAKFQGKAADGGAASQPWLPIVVAGDTVFVLYEPQRDNSAGARACWGYRLRAVAETWRAPSEDETLKSHLPLGWPMLHLLLEAAPAALTCLPVFEMLLATLRHPSVECKEKAAALLLRLLQLSRQELEASGVDERDTWNLALLLPLHRAVGWYARHREGGNLLARHAQLYAELVATVPGHGGLSDVTLPPTAVEEARRRVAGGRALPAALHEQYRDLTLLSSACVAILDEYRTAFEWCRQTDAKGLVPSAALSQCFGTLPPPALCSAARTVVKRWLKEAGESEIVGARGDEFPHWMPNLDAEIISLAEAFHRRLRHAKTAELTKPDFMRELNRIREPSERAGLAPYESLALRCISVLQMSPARVLQRWLVLQRYNKEVIRALPYCFTGLTKWPHTLGARVCALRALILADTKRKVWEDALPEGPSDEGVVKDGHVITLNRFEAEAAREDANSSKHKTLWIQAYSQLCDFDVKKLRRRDRAFKVKFLGEASDDYGGPFREAITNMCAELQHHPPRVKAPLFILTPNGQTGQGNNRSAYTVHPQTSGKLGYFAFFWEAARLLAAAARAESGSRALR